MTAVPQSPDTCIAAGTQCKKLLVLTWVADCEENNKKRMTKEKDLADDSDIEDSQEDDFVLVDSRVMLTLSGRTVRRPMRLDL